MKFSIFFFSIFSVIHLVTGAKYLVWSTVNRDDCFSPIDGSVAEYEDKSYVGFIGREGVRGLKYFVVHGTNRQGHFGIKKHDQDVYISVENDNVILTTSDPGPIFKTNMGMIYKDERPLCFYDGEGLCLFHGYTSRAHCLTSHTSTTPGGPIYIVERVVDSTTPAYEAEEDMGDRDSGRDQSVQDTVSWAYKAIPRLSNLLIQVKDTWGVLEGAEQVCQEDLNDICKQSEHIEDEAKAIKKELKGITSSSKRIKAAIFVTEEILLTSQSSKRGANLLIKAMNLFKEVDSSNIVKFLDDILVLSADMQSLQAVEILNAKSLLETLVDGALSVSEEIKNQITAEINHSMATGDLERSDTQRQLLAVVIERMWLLRDLLFFDVIQGSPSICA